MVHTYLSIVLQKCRDRRTLPICINVVDGTWFISSCIFHHDFIRKCEAFVVSLFSCVCVYAIFISTVNKRWFSFIFSDCVHFDFVTLFASPDIRVHW